MAHTIDDIIEHLGFGKFNCKLVVVLGFVWILSGMQMTVTSLISPYLRSEWGLTYLETALTEACVFLGTGVGEVYCGWIGDIYGRRKALIATLVLMLYFAVLSSFSNGLYIFIFTRYFVGIGNAVIIFSPCFIAELIPRKHCAKTILSLHFFFAFGCIFANFMAYLSMNSLGWKAFLILCTLSIPIPLLLSFWLPESVRYLQNTGKHEKVVNILHRISIENKIPMPTDFNIECKRSSKSGNVSVLFSRKYIMTTVRVMIMFIATLSSYYAVVLLNTEMLQSGMSFNIRKQNLYAAYHKLTDDDYLQSILVAFCEIPGVIFYWIIINRIGRKTCMILGLSITFVCLILLNMCLSPLFLTIIMFILRAITSGNLQMVYIYATEIYPTFIRASGLGFCTAVGRWSIIAVPFLVQLLMHISITMMTSVFNGFILFGIISVYTLEQDTAGRRIK